MEPDRELKPLVMQLCCAVDEPTQLRLDPQIQPSGKVLLRELREPYCKGHTRRVG